MALHFFGSSVKKWQQMWLLIFFTTLCLFLPQVLKHFFTHSLDPFQLGSEVSATFNCRHKLGQCLNSVTCNMAPAGSVIWSFFDKVSIFYVVGTFSSSDTTGKKEKRRWQWLSCLIKLDQTWARGQKAGNIIIIFRAQCNID